ncbi:hypothetical protein PR202_gb04730 [Eleusine coracana subsp. coracana]|uniref:Casein kinase substrate phosphoprotein PP28 domain-containing protein n=1 Tax=Eleusine coracana subsp. coracana TaxID=191504 RepID=A0AAV5E538_ELECO|nr:hypothetical protein PR202_gb04730 [Eleusine coracana subsp. coracana]
MGRGKFKGKPTGRRNFSTPEEIGNDAPLRPFPFISFGFGGIRCRNIAEEEVEEEEREESEEEESEDESDDKPKHKGTEGLIQIENPNLVKAKNIKAKEVDLGKTTELSRREREELEKQKAHERYMKLQEQGKTEQSRKDLERLALIRQQRADAAKKREEEKAAKEQRKAEARK